MAIKRVVSTEFWTDEKVINEYSVDDRYFFLYLLTNPHTSLIGIYRLVPKQVSFETGFNIDVVNALIERFEKNYGIIRYNRDTCEVAIKNYLKHSIVSGGKPVYDQLEKESKGVKDKAMLSYIADQNKDNPNKTVSEFFTNHPFPPAPPNPVELYGNGNGDSSANRARIVNDSSIPNKINEKQTRHKYGAYDNVLLTDADLEKLKAEFPDWMARIEHLSEYMASKGKVYKGHLATIRLWAKRDKEEGRNMEEKVKWA